MNKEQEQFKIVYKDNGPGFLDGVIKDREGGLGNYLLRNMARQLKGEVITENDGGAVSTIYFSNKTKSKTKQI